MFKYYRVYIFTSSTATYANPIIDRLDRAGRLSGRFFRPFCTQIGGVLVKDILSMGFPRAGSILVDNSALAYSLCRSNAIPIRDFFGAPTDSSLRELTPLLKRLADPRVTDVSDLFTLPEVSRHLPSP
mmetsp:Transcript_10361/g.26075  ORF Transcript_10361/g.26075 Transcript_10361/m.26075 type:complete len:128 (-) Transcript_10361:507-890(-)